MFGIVSSNEKNMQADHQTTTGFMLWIDGVGAYQACLQSEVTIGGPTLKQPASISLMANLSRQHATLIRQTDTWSLTPQSDTKIDDRVITEKTQLRSGQSLNLGESVELGFRQPTSLSVTAVIDFISDHRPARSVDGIVLIDENCLLGPGPENHIVCPTWPDSIVLFKRNNKWWCKSRMPIAVDGDIVLDEHEIAAGSTIAGEESRMRIEAL